MEVNKIIPYGYKNAYTLLENYIKRYCKGKILDYGCGKGEWAKVLSKYGEVTGIDIDEKALEIAKKNTNCKFEKQNCYKTNFFDRTFDIVFCSGTLSLLDKEKALWEINRILKLDGVFLGIDAIDRVIMKPYRFLVRHHCLTLNDLHTMEDYLEMDFTYFPFSVVYVTL